MMNDIKTEMQMLDEHEGEGEKKLRARWAKVEEDKKILFDSWVRFTEQEETRRVNLHIEWQNNVEEDAVTELTTATKPIPRLVESHHKVTPKVAPKSFQERGPGKSFSEKWHANGFV